MQYTERCGDREPGWFGHSRKSLGEEVVHERFHVRSERRVATGVHTNDIRVAGRLWMVLRELGVLQYRGGLLAEGCWLHRCDGQVFDGRLFGPSSCCIGGHRVLLQHSWCNGVHSGPVCRGLLLDLHLGFQPGHCLPILHSSHQRWRHRGGRFLSIHGSLQQSEMHQHWQQRVW